VLDWGRENKSVNAKRPLRLLFGEVFRVAL
jgi:hypothetical protein